MNYVLTVVYNASEMMIIVALVLEGPSGAPIGTTHWNVTQRADSWTRF